MRPHSLPLTLIGTGILWFGWFGFNAGSALAADGIAINAFVTTQIAAAVAALAWVVAEWMKTGKPTTLGAASGAVAGLVAITPGAGFVSPMSAIVIGLAGGFVCFGAVSLKFEVRLRRLARRGRRPPGRGHRRIGAARGLRPELGQRVRTRRLACSVAGPSSSSRSWPCWR